MKALLLIAHGSRREASNEEVRELAQRLEQVASGSFAKVVPAFLELAEPGIQDGIGLCVEQGATEVVAVPYFLAAGRHVATDIPEQIEKAACRHPGLRLRQSDHLGKHHAMARNLLALAQDSVAVQEASDTAT